MKKYDLLLNHDLAVETFAVLTKAAKLDALKVHCGSMAQVNA